MPSRKSNVSTATNGAADEGSPATSRAPRDRESTGTSVEDLSLPRTMISRLSKGVLPPNTQIQRDALAALSKSATVFVNYIATQAMDNASGAGKKTIQPNDVLVALKDTEFDFMIPRIEAELKKYNTVQCDKRNSYRRKVKADKAEAAAGTSSSALPSSTLPGADSSTATTPLPDIEGASTSRPSNGDDEPPTKKIRRSGGEDLLDDEDLDEDDVDDGAEDAAEDDEGEIDEDEEMEDDDDEDEDDEEAEGRDEVDGLETEDDRIQRQMRDEALDEGGESD